MEQSPLSKKLLIREGARLQLLNAPDNYLQLLAPLPAGVDITESDPVEAPDVVNAFVFSKRELDDAAALIKSIMKPDTAVWIAYPKKTSGIKTDLTMNLETWNLKELELSPAGSAAIDDTWTGIRLKPTALIKRSGVGNREIAAGDLGKYIDVKNKKVTLPPELSAELQNHPSALMFFQSLSYTYQKEYVTWILTAKQDATRQSRVLKTREKLLAGMKNPSQK